MVAPIDYTLQGVQSPFQSFLQAAQVGANISQVQTQREAMLAKAQEAQQAQERQDMINRRLAEIRAKPNRTIDDYAEVAPYMNQGQLAFLTQQFKSQSEVKQQNDLLFLGETLSALRANKPDTAIARLRTQADAEEAISPQRAKAYRDGAKMAEADPAAAELIIGPLLRALPGSDKILDALSKSEGGGVTISAPADKIKAGLVDDKGQPLPGTFFAAPGKKPELVEGTKPKAGFQVLTPENARARGLPTQGFTWQVNESTGEVSSLVKPPQAAVQVNMPGLPQPLSPIQQKIDETFAKTYVDWNTGGASNAASRIAQLNAVTKVLESGKAITGPVLGLVPDTVLSFLNPKSIEARQNAEIVYQEGLKAVLGPQFTKPEGEAYLARAFNPKLGEKENLRRMKKFVVQLETARQQTQAMVDFVNKNKTLAGFEGKIPSMGDFYKALEVEAETPAAAPAGAPTEGARRTSNSGRPITFRNGQWVYD